MLFTREGKEYHDQVVLLTLEEIQNPMETIRSVFSEMKVGEFRDVLIKTVEVCLTTTNYPFSKATNRYELLSTFRKLQLLIEAASLLD